MASISYARHRFPPEVIRHAIWLYVRFTLSYRDVEELLAERTLDISYETIRRWVRRHLPATCDACDPDPLTPGTWMRWWSRSSAGACISGARSTVKARSSSSWASRDATRRPLFGAPLEVRSAAVLPKAGAPGKLGGRERLGAAHEKLSDGRFRRAA